MCQRHPPKSRSSAPCTALRIRADHLPRVPLYPRGCSRRCVAGSAASPCRAVAAVLQFWKRPLSGQNQPAAVADNTSSKRTSVVRVDAGPDHTCKAFGATNHPFRKYAPLIHARPVIIVARQYPRRSVNGHPDSSCIVPCRLLRRRIERSFFEPKPARRAKIIKRASCRSGTSGQ